MKAVILHGQSHKGSTYHITKMLIDELNIQEDNIKEFRVNDVKPCVGCFTCIVKDEKLCPQADAIQPIIAAIVEADIVVAESPNYCMGMTGQMKIFFDHLAYRWISHRPEPSMKHKIGIAISTTAGIGAGTVTKQIRQQFFWWGIPITYRFSVSVAAMSWKEVKDKKKESIEKNIKQLVSKIKRKSGKVKPGIKSRFMFHIMKMQQKGNTWNMVDKKHWETNGWI